MLFLKITIYLCIFISCSLIGMFVSKKYSNRVNELKEFKNALNIFKTKIKYTYDTLPEIFDEISRSLDSNISSVFKVASEKMNLCSAGEAWELALKMEDLSINSDDIDALKQLGKLLGKTDLDGQISRIDMTLEFLEKQIIIAEKLKYKNEKMYRTLGMIMGIAIVIILV